MEMVHQSTVQKLVYDICEPLKAAVRSGLFWAPTISIKLTSPLLYVNEERPMCSSNAVHSVDSYMEK